MKKILKYISVFMFMLVTFSSAFFITDKNNNVKAADYVYNHTQQVNSGAVGSVTITSEGLITVTATYGISEFLVIAVPCKKTSTKNGTCEGSGWDKDRTTAVHASGVKGKVEKNIHLFNYFEYDEVVKVSLVYTIAEGEKDGMFSSMTYCNPSALDDTEKDICGKSSIVTDYKGNPNKNAKLYITNRIGNYDASIKQSYFLDKKGLVYGSTVNNTLKVDSYRNTDFIVQINNTKFAEEQGDVEKIIFDVVVPVLLGVLVLCAIVSGSVIGYKIVKLADEPQERQEQIKLLKSILIGLAMGCIALFVLKPLTNLVSKLLE